MNLAALFLLASTLHAGPEVAIAEPARDAQPHVQVVGDIAASDDLALVVWHDGTVLRGVRVDRDGNTLDAVPLLIAYAPWEGAWVARGATNWLVATWGPDRVVATIVEDDGTVRPSIPISADTGWPRVAFDGNAYLLAWYTPTQRGRILGARISADGEILENDILLPPFLIVDLLPAAGGGFVWVGQQAEVVAFRLDAQARAMSGTTLWRAPIPHDAAATLEPDGKVVLGWKESDGTSRLKRQDSDALVLAAEDVEDFVTISGTTYAVVRAHDRTSLVTLAGDSAGELPATQTARAVSFGDRVLVATSDQDVRMTLLDTLLQTVAPERLVYTEARMQSDAAIAKAGDTRLVAWTEGEGETGRITARIGDGEPFLIGEGHSVEVASDGQDFLVAWHLGFLTSFRRVLRDGTMMEPVGIAPWTWGDSCLAWTGSDYVLAYITATAYPRAHIRTVEAQRLTRDGALSGDAAVVSGTRPIHAVACASTKTTTLFAWADEEGNVDGSTLSHGGTPVRIHIGTGTSVSVATHGDGFLVAWAEHPAGRALWTTVSEGGTVGQPRAIESRTIDIAARPGGYLLLYGKDPLLAQTLDGEGNPSGPTSVIAQDAAEPSFVRGTIVYQRDTDILSRPRWQVFLQEIEETPARRRATR
jgi:hypothetical protein